MAKTLFRIGQIVPSSNTTMETELPALLRAREAVAAERFSFHSSRMRLQQVTAAELAAMDAPWPCCSWSSSCRRRRSSASSRRPSTASSTASPCSPSPSSS